MVKKLSIEKIVKELGGIVHGNAQREVVGINTLKNANSQEISFLANPKYESEVLITQAGCVIIGSKSFEKIKEQIEHLPQEQQPKSSYIEVEDSYLYFARLTQMWKKFLNSEVRGSIHPTAVVHEGAQLHSSVSVGPLCVVEENVRIGAHTVLKANVFVGSGCVIGECCIIHAGAVIGADGFGFAPEFRADEAKDEDSIRKASKAKVWVKIEQMGGVQIGDDVEIGANTCIDRGALQNTVIEDGVKIDNLVQIGHNVRVGKHTIIAGCAAIAGSTTVGAYCEIGGGAGLAGHSMIADHVRISAATPVMGSISEPIVYTGVFPSMQHKDWAKNATIMTNLVQLRERLKFLEGQYAKYLSDEGGGVRDEKSNSTK